MVMAPVLLRPPVRGFTASSGLCGLSVVMSSLTSFVWKRRVGVIGRNVLIGIADFLAILRAACCCSARYLLLLFLVVRCPFSVESH
jgi:hypothetical protein